MNAPADPPEPTTSTALDNRSAMADDTPVGRLPESSSATGRFALTARILIVNILPLALLGGGLFYLDSYRTQLINERFNACACACLTPTAR